MAPVVAVELRPLRPQDRDTWLRAVGDLSPRTRALRFAGAKRVFSDAEVERLLDMGHDGREALVAVAPGGTAPLGVVRYAPAVDRPDAAEVAVVVADTWQGRGLGRRMLREIAAAAVGDGYRTLVATTEGHNEAARRLLRGAGFTRTAVSAGTLFYEADAELVALGAGE